LASRAPRSAASLREAKQGRTRGD